MRCKGNAFILNKRMFCMFFLVFFFLGDFGVIGEFRVIGKFREISFILYHLAKAAKCRLALSFIIYHLARLGVRMLHAACCVEEY
jgi:hypothetical protein